MQPDQLTPCTSLKSFEGEIFLAHFLKSSLTNQAHTNIFYNRFQLAFSTVAISIKCSHMKRINLPVIRSAVETPPIWVAYLRSVLYLNMRNRRNACYWIGSILQPLEYTIRLADSNCNTNSTTSSGCYCCLRFFSLIYVCFLFVYFDMSSNIKASGPIRPQSVL